MKTIQDLNTLQELIIGDWIDSENDTQYTFYGPNTSFERLKFTILIVYDQSRFPQVTPQGFAPYKISLEDGNLLLEWGNHFKYKIDTIDEGLLSLEDCRDSSEIIELVRKEG